jgi:hypothetical protein
MTPSRHSTLAIDKFWPTMQAVSSAWPRVILVNPAPLGAETFACRFRDAVRGITEFGQGTQDQLASILPWFASFSVVNRHGQLLVGPPTEIKKVLKQQTQAISYGSVISGEAVTSDTPIDNPDDKLLAAIVLLLEHNIIQHITLSNTTEQAITKHFTGARPLEVMTQNNTLTIF